MSEDFGYACLTHDPPILGDTDLNHGRDMLFEALDLVRRDLWPRRPDGFGGYEDQGVFAPGGTHEWRGPITFLRQHPHCRIAIYSEYGDTYFTDGGRLLQVSGPDERSYRRPVRDADGKATGQWVDGTYPPEGEVECSCIQHTPAVKPEYPLARRGGWVRCLTCGGLHIYPKEPT